MAPKPKAGKQFLTSKQSDVATTDAQGNVYKGFHIWGRFDPDEDGTTYRKCLVLPGSSKEVLKVKLVDPPSDEEIELKKGDAFNLNQNLDPFSFSDIGTLPHTNTPCVLDFLKQRLIKAQIYSTADPLLVAINPYKDIGVAGTDTIIKYRDIGDVTKLTPHVFGIARRALESLHMVRKSQTIIVSGESGAGKTEATKQIMRYFAAAKSGTTDLRIQTAVLAANPVLEAFGNAKTTRNNNSSRFGRFMMLSVAVTGGITFGTVRNFLLEKSRILTQEPEERNYHIFYQLLKGADPDLRKKLHLKDLNSYSFVNPKCPDADGIDDLEEWADVEKSLESMGMSKEQKFSVFSIVSGVILMGNVKLMAQELDGVPDASVIDPACRDEYEKACDLLFLDKKMTEEGFCIKISFAGGKEIRGRWGVKDGQMLKDSLCKAMYDKLFFWITTILNANIEPKEPFKHFMGMLDIFGFEVFQNNSLEQLFINITNEMLQKNFTDVVFEKELALYRDEGISAADLVWTSNAAVINMLTAKKGSLMAVLDDQCLAPGGTDEKFLANAYTALKENPKLIRPKVASNVNFMVDHTIGEIQYLVVGFLFKNKDVLRPDLVEVVQASENVVTKELFAGMVVERGKMKGQYIGAQFIQQLDELMTLINSTEPHFIRCVKPNETKTPLVFDQTKTLIQLHSLSILEALQLRNLGYSYRRPFDEFLFQFRFIDLSVTQNTTNPAKDNSATLMKRTKIDEGWQIGKNMIFLKPDVAKLLVQKQRQAMASWEPLSAMIEALYALTIARRKLVTVEPTFLRLQAHCRKKLAGKGAKTPLFTEPLKAW